MLRKYLTVYSKFLQTSLASELEYKTNIIIDLLTAILSLCGSIFLLAIFNKSKDVLSLLSKRSSLRDFLLLSSNLSSK